MERVSWGHLSHPSNPIVNTLSSDRLEMKKEKRKKKSSLAMLVNWTSRCGDWKLWKGKKRVSDDDNDNNKRSTPTSLPAHGSFKTTTKCYLSDVSNCSMMMLTSIWQRNLHKLPFTFRLSHPALWEMWDMKGKKTRKNMGAMAQTSDPNKIKINSSDAMRCLFQGQWVIVIYYSGELSFYFHFYPHTLLLLLKT